MEETKQEPLDEGALYDLLCLLERIRGYSLDGWRKAFPFIVAQLVEELIVEARIDGAKNPPDWLAKGGQP